MNYLKTVLLFIALLLVTITNFSCNRKIVKSTSKPVSHEQWDALLKKHVSADGKVDYKGFITDKKLLNAYLETLSASHPNVENWTEKERLVYWINAYNAYTVDLVARNYPVVSIKDIKKGIPFVSTVWDIRFIEIEGKTYDLNEIEHGILRKEFKEPRIHFAIVCASISCPSLRPEAYVAEKLEQQLLEQAKAFINDSSRNKITAKQAQFSKIFSWFKGDFTNNGSLINFINQYSEVKINADAKIGSLDYDWGLNE